MTQADDTSKGATAETAPNLSTIVNGTGLPQTIRSRAVSFFTRLIAGTVAAPIVSEAREQMDTFEARSRVNMLIADEVARQAIADPQLMERAKARFLSQEFQKQENVEAVARMAAEELRDEKPNPAAPEFDQEADADWINLFARHAEAATSERMRALFAKVLAGEIRKPGSFSPTTMRMVSELDPQTARDFQVLANHAIGHVVLRDKKWQEGPLLLLGLRMEAAGLAVAVGGLMERSVVMPEQGAATFVNQTFGLAIEGTAGTVCKFPVFDLTRVGEELASILPRPDEAALLRELSVALPKDGLRKISLGIRDQNFLRYVDVLWEVPGP